MYKRQEENEKVKTKRERFGEDFPVALASRGKKKECENREQRLHKKKKRRFFK